MSTVSDGTGPQLIEGLKDTAVEAANDITLKCKVNPGKPKATAEWYDSTDVFSTFRILELHF